MRWIKWVILIVLAGLPGVASGADLVLSGAGTIVNIGVYENVTVSAANCILYNVTITGTLTVSESVELRSCDVYAVTFGAAAKTLTAWCTGFETQTAAEIALAGSTGTVTDGLDPEGNSTNVFNEPARRDSLNRPANPAYHSCDRSDKP
jgi:hypothetical protein